MRGCGDMEGWVEVGEEMTSHKRGRKHVTL